MVENAKENVEALQTEQAVLPWLSHQMSIALKALRKPTEEDIDTFINLPTDQGGIIYLQDCILTQILPKADAPVLKALALRIHTEESFADLAIKSQLVSDLLIAAAAKLVL
ncbi:hypothetical protein PHLCEN_2v10866, partial [Hermanssonia centrifuga]